MQLAVNYATTEAYKEMNKDVKNLSVNWYKLLKHGKGKTLKGEAL